MQGQKNSFFKLNYTLIVIAFVALIIVIPMALYLLEWQRFIQDKKQAVYSAQEDIDEKITSVKSLLNYTFFDCDFQKSLQKSIGEKSQNDAEKVYERLTVSTVLRDTVSAIWYFPLSEENQIMYDDVVMSADSMSSYMQYIADNLNKFVTDTQGFNGEYFSFPFGADIGKSVAMIIGHRVLSSMPENYLQPIGVGVAIINLSGFTDDFTSKVDFSGISIGLYDEQGDIIFGNSDVNESQIDEKYYKVTIKSRHFGLKTIAYFDGKVVFDKFLPYLFSIVAIILFLGIFFFLYLWTQERKKSRVYEAFIDTFRKIGEGDLDKRIETYNIEELDIVGKQFNSMMDSMLTLNEELANEKVKTYYNEVEKDRYLLKYLSTQINKHFIFNTFAIIRSFVNLDKNQDASDCIDLLCNYLRFTFKGKDFVTVIEEISALKNYLDIQKIRIRNVNVEMNVDERLYDCEIPQFILQPIVENAYKHAFSVEGGTIVIEGKIIDADLIEFSISDNGVGVDNDKLASLNRGLEFNEEIVGAGEIGLINVQRRLKILTGNDSCIKIESRTGKGTKVILRLGRVKTDKLC